MAAFDGSWVNHLGSVLRLKSHGSFVFGSYQSEFGLTGKFHVCGYADASPLIEERGLGIALSVLWRPIENATPAPSWHWVSGLSGQLITLDDNGPQLILHHDLVVTQPNHECKDSGSYLDKMTYRQSDHGGATLATIGNFRVSDHQDAINGLWQCEAPDLNLSIELQVKDAVSGWLDGYVRVNGVKFVLQGFTDNQAGLENNELTRQGLTICSSLSEGRFMTLSGYFDRQQRQLVLLQQISQGTSPSTLHLQTSAKTCYFTQVPSKEAVNQQRAACTV